MGLLMSALGGAASAGVSMLQDERKNDAIEARDVRLETFKEQLQAKRAETVARIAQETELAHQKRDQAQYDQIDDNAKSTGYKRDADDMKKIGADFSQEDAKELSPAVRSAYQKAGLIGTATSLTDAKDRADEGRRIGAHPTIRKELDSVYQTEAKDARSKAELESKENREKARLEESARKADLQHDGTIKSINARGSSGSSGGSDGAKITREERLRYTTLFSDAGKRLSEAQTALGKVMPGKMGEAERASLQESISGYKEERALYQGLLAESQSPNAPKAPEKAKPEPSKPITALPSGAKQVGTSGGKPVFQTPDGKRFIGN